MASTSDADATNGLSRAMAASVPYRPPISPDPVFQASAQIIAAHAMGNSSLQLSTFLRDSNAVTVTTCLNASAALIASHLL